MEITELLSFAQKNKSSDLHLVGGKDPMVRIDGGLRPIKTGDWTFLRIHSASIGAAWTTAFGIE